MYDVDQLKDRYPVEDVAAERYGIELRRVGQVYRARCPFHPDGRKPNFYVIPHRRNWCCHACGMGGDVFRLVMLLEPGLDPRNPADFPRAVRILTGEGPATARRRPAPVPTRIVIGIREGRKRACLAAAVDLYHRALLAEPSVLGYLAARGVGADV